MSVLVRSCVRARVQISLCLSKSYDMCTFKLWRLLHTVLMRLTLDSGRFVALYAGLGPTFAMAVPEFQLQFACSWNHNLLGREGVLLTHLLTMGVD